MLGKDLKDDDFKKYSKRTKQCSDYIKRFDKLILRPILIHKYHKDRNARAQEFYEMFQDENN